MEKVQSGMPLSRPAIDFNRFKINAEKDNAEINETVNKGKEKFKEVIKILNIPFDENELNDIKEVSILNDKIRDVFDKKMTDFSQQCEEASRKDNQKKLEELKQICPSIEFSFNGLQQIGIKIMLDLKKLIINQEKKEQMKEFYDKNQDLFKLIRNEDEEKQNDDKKDELSVPKNLDKIIDKVKNAEQKEIDLLVEAIRNQTFQTWKGLNPSSDISKLPDLKYAIKDRQVKLNNLNTYSKLKTCINNELKVDLEEVKESSEIESEIKAKKDNIKQAIIDKLKTLDLLLIFLKRIKEFEDKFKEVSLNAIQDIGEEIRSNMENILEKEHTKLKSSLEEATSAHDLYREVHNKEMKDLQNLFNKANQKNVELEFKIVELESALGIKY